MSVYILAIESSCDDTSAAVSCDNKILANIIANQSVHESFGGVVPELASRAHQQNIIPVVAKALSVANINKNQLHAIAFTNGPGLLGSLLVGTSFAKAMALGLDIPIIAVNHLDAHILSHFIVKNSEDEVPSFPFLCLVVSGGHTKILQMNSYFESKVVGQTIDDAAGEAFDKAAKIMGLTYPGGPIIDKLAKQGNANKFSFAHPRITSFDYSFSGLKTSFLYLIRDNLKENANFIEQNKADLAAAIQKTIIDVLMDKLIKAAKETGINEIAVAGGVSANSGLREALIKAGQDFGWNVYIPPFEYTTDNAAMVAITAYYKYLHNDFASQNLVPYTRDIK